ncbi:MAG: hypothetical protein ACO1PN_05000, partial [Betaproteobacteria bacterium]
PRCLPPKSAASANDEKPLKLRGIQDSKARRVVYERNQTMRAPTTAGLDPQFHKPRDGPDGTLICSCGSASYSPAAFAQHISCTGPKDMEGGVLIAGAFDPWLASQRASPDNKQHAQEEMEAVRRAELVHDYYAKQTRARARIVEGVAVSIAD